MEPTLLGNKLDPENITIKTDSDFYDLLEFLEINHLSDNIEAQYQKPLPKVMEDTEIVFSFIKGHDKINEIGGSADGEYIFHFVTFNTYINEGITKRQMFCISFKNIIAIINYCHNLVTANKLTTVNVKQAHFSNPVLSLISQGIDYIKQLDMYPDVVFHTVKLGTVRELENLVLIAQEIEEIFKHNSSVQIVDESKKISDEQPNNQPANTTGMQALLRKLGS
jgi:hypothetical protein